ncbi:MAG: hypothetical protein ACYDIA_00670 [Candidatus Humimicrobiaceae bacterium]
MKKALMIIAMVAIVAIAGSMVYYFVFFRPNIAKAEIELQEQKLELKKSSQVKGYLSEYNAIRQEFLDKLNLYPGSKDKLQELQEIRRKLMMLSAPEGYNKYNDVKSSCLNAMNGYIDILIIIETYDAMGTKVDDNLIKELVDKQFKYKRILESLSIND